MEVKQKQYRHKTDLSLLTCINISSQIEQKYTVYFLKELTILTKTIKSEKLLLFDFPKIFQF